MAAILDIPYRFVAVEGNIGAGKTTLSQMLAADLDARLVLEEFADNPFLPYFYDNPERYAFTVELFFMTERHKQLQGVLLQQELFRQRIVSDYYFVKTLLFAGRNLNSEEYRLFSRLFHILNAAFPKPDLLVYLHRPVDQLIGNIRQRGRTYEQQIPAEYLANIQQAYFDYFKTPQEIPILVLDVNGIDFVRHAEHYHRITRLVQQPYEPGVHHLSLRTT